MLKKLLRLMYTIQYIKRIQLFYQVWYRIKNRFLSIHWYLTYLDNPLLNLNCKIDKLLQTEQQEYFPDNQFTFIGLQYSFKDEIDWNFQKHGKLWNYNLQYFSYLLDEKIAVEKRNQLLKDFSLNLLSGQIKPEPYPVSLRIINTLLFHGRHGIVDSDSTKALQLQIDYLQHNLEYHLLANHLLENYFALYVASFALNNDKLYRKSCLYLQKKLSEQILADGAHYERSPMYHSILLAKLLVCIDISKRNDRFDTTILPYLEKIAREMLGWIQEFSFPDGSWALMNDAAHDIAPNTNQLIRAGEFLGIHPIKGTLLSSGFRKLRGKDWEALINVGNIRPSYQPGHAHADMLSFCVWHKGEHIVIDPGTSTYAISEQRSYERSTLAHNTVTVNKKNQSDVWGGFRIGKRADCYIVQDTDTMIEAFHDGYRNMKIEHRRCFQLKNDQLYLSDEIINKKGKPVDCKGSILINGKGKIVKQHSSGIVLERMRIEANRPIEVQESSAAFSFHNLQPALCLTYQVTNKVDIRFEFL